MLALYAQIATTEHIPLVTNIVQQLENFNGELHIHSLGSRDLRAILRAILAQPHELRSLIIEKCDLYCLSVALSNTICAATELEVLTFDQCQFAVNALYTQVLANLHLTKICELSIINCKLTDSQLVSFARSLESLPYLTKLCLSHNYIKDSTITQLFKSLQTYSLDTLDLRFCGLKFQSGKTILSFLDSYPGNIKTLLLDYNNFSTNLQNHLLQRCATTSSQPLNRGLSRSRSSSKSPQERRSAVTTRTSLRTKITGLHQQDNSEEIELGNIGNPVHTSPIGTRFDSLDRGDSLDIIDLRPHSLVISGDPGSDEPLATLSSSSHTGAPDSSPQSLAEDCSNHKELVAFLNKHVDDIGAPLDVDLRTFKWTFSDELTAFQAIISSCQKRKEKLSSADLRTMLTILRRLHSSSIVYNGFLQLDMKHKLNCAIKRSEAYIEIQKQNAELISKRSILEDNIALQRNELQELRNKLLEVEKNIEDVDKKFQEVQFDDRISDFVEKITVIRTKNTELEAQFQATQRMYEELLTTEYTQQSSAANSIIDIRKTLPSYASVRDDYYYYLFNLVEELLDRVQSQRDELQNLLDAIKIHAV